MSKELDKLKEFKGTFTKVKDDVDLNILLEFGFKKKPNGIYIYEISDEDKSYKLIVNTKHKLKQCFRVLNNETVGFEHYLPIVIYKLFTNNLLELVKPTGHKHE